MEEDELCSLRARRSDAELQCRPAIPARIAEHLDMADKLPC
jgi:hypothetical protein